MVRLSTSDRTKYVLLLLLKTLFLFTLNVACVLYSCLRCQNYVLKKCLIESKLIVSMCERFCSHCLILNGNLKFLRVKRALQNQIKICFISKLITNAISDKKSDISFIFIPVYIKISELFVAFLYN